MRKNLKKTAAVLTAVFMLALSAIPAVSFAYEGDYNSGIYRINDFCSTISDSDIDTIDNHALELMNEYKIDMPVAIIDNDTLSGHSADEYMDWYYDHNDYGYGSDKSGILLLLVEDKGKGKCKAYGSAEKMFKDQDLKDLVAIVASSYKSSGMKSALNSYYDKLAEDCAAASPSAKTENDSQTDTSAQNQTPPADQASQTNTSGMPAWYPADVGAFTDFHNENAPRVIDTADIFTDAEEAEMTEKAKAIVEKYDRDFVIFTDISTYGLSRGVYAADFYQFNGYGLGDDYTGSILFICMEEGNRGWWSAARGSTREYFTEENINWIDDRLEPYMVDGDYGEGVLDYIDNLELFYRQPDWVPEDTANFQRFHADNQKVVDNMGALTADQIKELEAKAESICDTYDTDILIILDRVLSMGASEMGRSYAMYKGYGAGDDYECSIFAVNDSQSLYWSCIFEGDRDCFNDQSRERLSEWLEDPMYGENYYNACSKYLTKLEKMYKKGHVPKKLSLVFPAIVSALIGLIAAAISTAVIKSRMSNVAAASGAAEYTVPGSFQVTASNDVFRTKNVKRDYNPKTDDSDSSSGGSSYSSSYSSSGGASFSGGGRSF